MILDGKNYYIIRIRQSYKTSHRDISISKIFGFLQEGNELVPLVSSSIGTLVKFNNQIDYEYQFWYHIVEYNDIGTFLGSQILNHNVELRNIHTDSLLILTILGKEQYFL